MSKITVTGEVKDIMNDIGWDIDELLKVKDIKHANEVTITYACIYCLYMIIDGKAAKLFVDDHLEYTE